jgi:8-oxo-dGTP diphosphatase
LHQVGLHLNTISLGQLSERPVADGVWLSASCHNPFELQRAESIGVDFACLSPVKTTQSHPQAAPLGWLLFADWVMEASIPVFALGGMIDADLERAMASGAQGIAGISNWWD